MSERLLELAERIRSELSDVERLVGRVQEGWLRAERSADDLYLDSVALNLHGFYAGLERLFQTIAAAVDGTMPRGANWHQVLLQQMAVEAPSSVRPAVISERSRDALDEYRGFRHIVRHVYTFKFDPGKVQPLVEHMQTVFRQVRSEMLAFADFLEAQGREEERD
ncbi:hypothetical protein MELA_01124 [Candidatus Methylomirabilis lanthanidiphila]|uniref:HepT-like domain-containing protein n=1 Tax=Candidatus Methylomirabilis lanthanidiphila TaxID=2211376 RepID=A0A564ZHD8_9BACT|nr:hypothetical protein [Candidatus Methylomirabilis lanthanidiphila]VUZ84750.1 hypothetical protein MELA_01124 [Candidatus Methylomirabilis lanthanidiphila]